MRRSLALRKARLVKILMRRDCSIGVGRRDVLDSRRHVADRAQAEQERGRAERCSCLGDCVLRDTTQQTQHPVWPEYSSGSAMMSKQATEARATNGHFDGAFPSQLEAGASGSGSFNENRISGH